MSSRIFAFIASAASALMLQAGAEEIGQAWMASGKPIVHNGEANGGSCAFSGSPDGKALKISWAAKRAEWLDVEIYPHASLPGPGKSLAGTLSVSVLPEGADDVTAITPRFIDAKGEVFQWRQPQPLKLSNKGWTEISYEINAANFSDSWSGGKTGIVKLPAKLLGFAVSFKSKTGAPGSLSIGKICFSDAGAELPYSESVYKFDDSERWQLRPQAKASVKSDGMSIAWQLADKKQAFLSMSERKASLEDIGSPERLILETENSPSLETELGLVIRDFKGRSFLLKPRKCGGGASESAWTLSTEEVASAWGPGEGKEMTPPLSVAEIRASVKSGAEGSTTLFKSLRAEGSMKALDALKVDVSTGSPLRIAKPGAPVAIEVENIARAPQEFTVEATLKDFSGESAKASAQLLAAAGGTCVWQLPFSVAKRGIWHVDYTIYDKSLKGKKSGSTSFCVMEPSGKYVPPGAPAAKIQKGPKRDFVFGMNTHTERWAKKEQELEVMASALLGVKAVRTGCEWNGLEPEQGVWNWENEDSLVELYARNGMELQPLLGFCARWAAPEETRNSKNWLDWSRSAPEISAWRKYCYEFAKRYSGRISTVEVWNEPDIGFFNGTEEQYLEMMKSAYEEVKKADPSIQVMTGGFATLGYHPSTKKGFHKNVVRLGQDFFDIYATHEHGNFESYAAIVDGPMAEVKAQLKSPKAWYPNETAFASMNGEASQAIALIQKMVFSMSRGAIGYNWYDLRNDGWNPKDAEHNYGLLTNDFHPKAAYVAYNTLSSVVKGMASAGQLKGAGADWAFAFSGQGSAALSLWNSSFPGCDSAILASGLSDGAKQIDIMGNETPLKVIDGKAVAKVSPIPSFIKSPSLSGAAPSISEFIGFDRLPACCPGESFVISGSVKNPLSKEAKLKLSALLPEGLSCEEPSQELTLPPGASKSFSVKAKASENASNDGNRKARILYELSGAWSGEVSLPVAMAYAIPASIEGRKPDFSLKSRANVFNFSEKDPNLAHLNWKGPEDLSCEVWLGRKPGALLLKVDVTDDIHFQDQPVQNCWQTDSIQMGLQVPGQKGFWELGLTLDAQGKPAVFCWSKAAGFEDPASKVALKAVERKGGVVYEAELPFEAFGLSDATLDNGLKFNMIVNDNDGRGRKGWVEIAPGIGQGKIPDLFPMLIFKR